MEQQSLKLVVFPASLFQVEVGKNLSVRLSPEQFAELSEQVFEYWRINIDKVAEVSSAKDVAEHLEWLKQGAKSELDLLLESWEKESK